MKKGFTLIELLAVIIVLGVVLAITIPNVMNSIKDTKRNSYNIAIKNIEKTASYYVNENVGVYRDQDSFVIALNDLCNQEYLECPVYNPITKEVLNGHVNVTKQPDDSFKYEFVEE